MAWIEDRATGPRVKWRHLHTKKQQSCKFRETDVAERAKTLVEAAGHDMYSLDLYAAIYPGLPRPAEPDEDRPLTLREWKGTWATGKTLVTDGTLDRYLSQYDKEIDSVFGDRLMDDIIERAVVAWLIDLGKCNCSGETPTQPAVRGSHCIRGHGLGPATRARYRTVLSSMLSSAVKNGKATRNGAALTDAIKRLIAYDSSNAGHAPHVYLRGEEYVLVRDQFSGLYRLLVEFFSDTGCRWGEATAVRPENLLLDDHLGQPLEKPKIQIKWAWKKRKRKPGKPAWYIGKTKGRRDRTIGISQELAALLREHLKTLPPHELPADPKPEDYQLVFAKPGNKRIDESAYLRSVWHPAIRAAKICAEHPPLPQARQVLPTELLGPLCGDNGGVRTNKRKCGARVVPGWNRCSPHLGAPKEAASTCTCPGVLRRHPKPHDLRHSHVAWLLASPNPPSLLVISRRLGHKSVTTTEQIYAGILDHLDEELVTSLRAYKKHWAATDLVTAQKKKDKSKKKKKKRRFTPPLAVVAA